MRSSSRSPRATSVRLVVALGSLACALAACGDGDAPKVESSRSVATVAPVSTTTTTLAAVEGAPPSSAAAVPSDGSATTVLPAGPGVGTTTTTLVGPDLPTTTIAGRRLYTVTGTLGVFPVSGTICAMDEAGAGGTLVAPDGSVVDEPDVGSISYGGEVTFAATTSSEGTFQFSIDAYSTNFTGNGTYSISWIDNRRAGYMELTEATGHASNPVVDQDDTSDQEIIFSLVTSGTC